MKYILLLSCYRCNAIALLLNLSMISFFVTIQMSKSVSSLKCLFVGQSRILGPKCRMDK